MDWERGYRDRDGKGPRDWDLRFMSFRPPTPTILPFVWVFLHWFGIIWHTKSPQLHRISCQMLVSLWIDWVSTCRLARFLALKSTLKKKKCDERWKYVPWVIQRGNEKNPSSLQRTSSCVIWWMDYQHSKDPLLHCHSRRKYGDGSLIQIWTVHWTDADAMSQNNNCKSSMNSSHMPVCLNQTECEVHDLLFYLSLVPMFLSAAHFC